MPKNSPLHYGTTPGIRICWMLSSNPSVYVHPGFRIEHGTVLDNLYDPVGV